MVNKAPSPLLAFRSEAWLRQAPPYDTLPWPLANRRNALQGPQILHCGAQQSMGVSVHEKGR